MDSVLKVENLNKNFGIKKVLKDISFNLKRGEIVSVLGKSGCGKSTLLRIIAGLESASSGKITTNKSVSLMFQNYALMPHLNVNENIALALHYLPKAQRKKRVDELCEKFFIKDLANSRIDEISGGQAQRVAFARALANEAEVLLLDEPFANLDTGLKSALRIELLNLIKNSGVSALLVTHDKDDAFVMSDRIALIHNGELVALDSAKSLYLHPKNALVASFLGEVNDLSELKERISSLNADKRAQFTEEFNEFYYELSRRNFIFRPEDVALNGKFKAKVLNVVYLGAYQRVKLCYADMEFDANIYESINIEKELTFGFKPLRN